MTRYAVGKAGLCLLAGLTPALAEGPARGRGTTIPATAVKPVPYETAKASAGMRVEEPAPAAGQQSETVRVPLPNHDLGLTEAQKAAFRERKEKMEGMIALIQAKRRAMLEAGPEERAVLARELHSLILEREDASADPQNLPAARLEGVSEAAFSGPAGSAGGNRAAVPERRDGREARERPDGHEMREIRAGRAKSSEEAAARREEMRQRRLEQYRNQRRSGK